MNRFRKIAPILIFILTSILLSACVNGAQIKERTYFNYFDTVSHIYSYANESEAEFEKTCREAVLMMDEYHKLFDIYNEYEGISNLCTLNREAGNSPIELDDRLVDFLLYTKELYYKTNGEMNVMMGSVLRLWHDFREDAKGNRTVPPESRLNEAALHTSIDLLEINKTEKTARISDPNASIDVGAIGKGYVAQIIASHLYALGKEGYVLNIGGNIRIIGKKPNGDGWVTGIKDPDNLSSYAMKLILSDTSCVTSGNYERYAEIDGVRYHHIIDKDTLMPANYFSSVTVICKDSALADSLSTALFCMNYEDGKSLVESMQGVDVVWIRSDGEMYVTDGIESLLAK